MTPKEITDLRVEGLMKFTRKELEQLYREALNSEYPIKSNSKKQVAQAVFEAASFKRRNEACKNIVV